MEELLRKIYDEILRRIKESNIFDNADVDKLRDGNIKNYFEEEPLITPQTSSDYPRAEIVFSQISPDGSTSNSELYEIETKVRVATGNVIYAKRLIPMSTAFLEVADAMKCWRCETDDHNAYAYGTKHSAIVVSAVETKDFDSGEGSQKGWYFDVTLTFKSCVKHGE